MTLVFPHLTNQMRIERKITFPFLSPGIRAEVFSPQETLISARPLNSHSPATLFPRNPLLKRDKYSSPNFRKKDEKMTNEDIFVLTAQQQIIDELNQHVQN